MSKKAMIFCDAKGCDKSAEADTGFGTDRPKGWCNIWIRSDIPTIDAHVCSPACEVKFLLDRAASITPASDSAPVTHIGGYRTAAR